MWCSPRERLRLSDALTSVALGTRLLTLWRCTVDIPGTFWTITKKFKLFPGGASPPQTPPSSRLLSQPPQARFERLSQVGRCRGLQGWEVLERYQARDWPGGPGPRPILFVSPRNKTKTGLFYFRRGVADPPPPSRKKHVFSFSVFFLLARG